MGKRQKGWRWVVQSPQMGLASRVHNLAASPETQASRMEFDRTGFRLQEAFTPAVGLSNPGPRPPSLTVGKPSRPPNAYPPSIHQLKTHKQIASHITLKSKTSAARMHSGCFHPAHPPCLMTHLEDTPPEGLDVLHLKNQPAGGWGTGTLLSLASQPKENSPSA